MLLLHRFLEGMTVGAKSTVANSLQRVDSPINIEQHFAPTRHLACNTTACNTTALRRFMPPLLQPQLPAAHCRHEALPPPP
mmetsp:Transcript_33722/g.80133  ORF Transcript_33722/g.80133 Transcript_33722/m.80133 type:complete len:81 (+) Transcript_33722:110-352(+)